MMLLDAEMQELLKEIIEIVVWISFLQEHGLN